MPACKQSRSDYIEEIESVAGVLPVVCLGIVGRVAAMLSMKGIERLANDALVLHTKDVIAAIDAAINGEEDKPCSSH